MNKLVIRTRVCDATDWFREEVRKYSCRHMLACLGLRVLVARSIRSNGRPDPLHFRIPEVFLRSLSSLTTYTKRQTTESSAIAKKTGQLSEKASFLATIRFMGLLFKQGMPIRYPHFNVKPPSTTKT